MLHQLQHDGSALQSCSLPRQQPSSGTHRRQAVRERRQAARGLLQLAVAAAGRPHLQVGARGAGGVGGRGGGAPP